MSARGGDSSVQKNAFQRLGSFVWGLLLFGFGLSLFLALSLLTSIVVEWVGMNTVWEDEGIEHSANMYRVELEYIHEDLANGVFRGGTIGVVGSVVDWAYDVVTPDPNGLVGRHLVRFQQPVYSSDWNTVQWIKRTVDGSEPYLHAARNITLVFMLRLTIIALSLPLFVLIVHGAAVEGLIQRERRKAGGGIESSFVYHHMKAWIAIVLLLPLVIYLASPVATHPNLALLPIAAVLGVLMYVYTLKFKKFL